MIERVVVSCPRCLRQYDIDATTDRLVAQCGVCKSHFVVVIPRLTGPAEDALVLEKEIEPGINFFKEGCETLARNACELLQLVHGPITPENVLLIVESLPTCAEVIRSDRWQEGALNKVLHHVFVNGLGDPAQRERLFEYFTGYIPGRSYWVLNNLQAAFAGVLGGLDWSKPDGASSESAESPAISVQPIPTKSQRRFFAWWNRKAESCRYQLHIDTAAPSQSKA